MLTRRKKMSKNKAQVNEGVLDDMDEDGWMAKSQLYQAAKYSIELHKMIQDTDNLEPWVQSKISKAADYLSSVKHYMEYESVNSYPGEATEEAPAEIEEKPMVAPVEVEEAPVENMESLIDEGYESSVLKVMKDHGIGAYFSNGVMYVDAMDMEKAKEALEQDSDIIELPKMMAEKTKETIGSDTDDLWMEKLAAAGLKSTSEGRMSDVAAAADEVSNMIDNGDTDQEIMDATGLNQAQVKFLRSSYSDRPQQYEGKYASKLPKGHKNYKAQQAAVAISKQGG